MHAHRVTRAAAALALAACGLAGGSARAAQDVRFERARAVIRTSDGRSVALRVELAQTLEQRARGLAGRRTLAANAGMLFLYGRDRRGSFWMRDTRMPLAVAFLDRRGRILRTLRMEPCRGDPCPLYDPGIRFRAALEVNAGFFARRRVHPGDVVRLVRR
jgi:uncharacterized protein